MLCQFTRLDSLLKRVGPVHGDLELSGREQVCDGVSNSAPGTAGHCPIAWRRAAWNTRDAEVPNGV